MGPAGHIRFDAAGKGLDSSVRRFALVLAATGVVATSLATTAAADPPQPPPGCAVAVGTPATVTGSSQGLANKANTFVRLCLVG